MIDLHKGMYNGLINSNNKCDYEEFIKSHEKISVLCDGILNRIKEGELEYSNYECFDCEHYERECGKESCGKTI